jgi:hypothetical protein
MGFQRNISLVAQRGTPAWPRASGVAELVTVLFVSALGMATLPAAYADDAPPAANAAPKETVRAEVGKPLQDALNLMKDKKYPEALAKIHEAELVPNRTPFENFTIDQMRGSAAANAGQDDVAVASYESAVQSGRYPPDQKIKLELAIASTYFNKLKNYPKAATWASNYVRDGGTDPTAQDLIINSHYLSNDYTSAINELKGVLEADEKAGRPTTEAHLDLLYTCYEKTNNSAGESQILEKLLASYPKKDYWALAISRLLHHSFAERLDLDLLRLRFAMGDFKKEGDYMDMAQLSLEAGYPAEAKKVVDAGYANGALGKGADAARHQRLQALVNKNVADDQKAISAGDVDAEKAKTGDGLMNTGYNYVINGKAEKGLALMEQGLKKGGLKHPEDSKMHLGIAYYYAGDKQKAAQILRSVQGNDGVGDLAHLWAVFAAGPGHT